jgi:hypothetical protein
VRAEREGQAKRTAFRKPAARPGSRNRAEEVITAKGGKERGTIRTGFKEKRSIYSANLPRPTSATAGSIGVAAAGPELALAEHATPATAESIEAPAGAGRQSFAGRADSGAGRQIEAAAAGPGPNELF